MEVRSQRPAQVILVNIFLLIKIFLYSGCRRQTLPEAFPGCSATDVSSQLNLQHHLLWSSGYLGYPAFTITSDITFLALGVKKGPGEGGHGDTGRREDKEDKLGCATMKSSSYCCTALGSSPQPQPVPISRVATSVLSLNTLLSNTLSSRSHLIPV